MEADTSIWRKTGHFYFALTRAARLYAEPVVISQVALLIVTAWPTHRAHENVQEWLSRHAREGWATCPRRQTAFVRILSNPAFSANALTPGDALALLRANLSHSGHRFRADELGFIQALEPLTPRLAGHQPLTEAYLLGLATHKKESSRPWIEPSWRCCPKKSREREFVELI